MAVLFHPSLGRFVDPDEYQHASGTDSDSYLRRRSAASRPTRREEGQHGAPGSRRHRRFLNSTMSESEFDTDAEFDSDEDRPIVRFEWKGTFFKAGTEFFDNPVQREAHGDPLRRRRLPKLMRRKRGEVVDISPENRSGTHTPEDEETVVVESKHALARRMRAAKFASATAGVSPSAASTSAGDTSDASESGHASSSVLPSSIPSGLQTKSISESSSSNRPKLAGQEHAPTLFLTVEHTVRRALRKADEVELSFLSELESVLIAYKTGVHCDAASIHTTFDLLPYDVASHEHDVNDPDTEVTDPDGEDEFSVVDHSKRRRKYAHGEEPLSMAFRNAFERFLAHGLVQFHQLVAVSHNNHADQRITEIRIPRHGVLLHSAKLVPHLTRVAQSKKRQH